MSISRDRSVKVFDVVGFDMIMMMKLPYTPGVAEWVFKVSSLSRYGAVLVWYRYDAVQHSWRYC